MNAPHDELPEFPDPPRPSRAEWERVRALVKRDVLPRSSWAVRAAWVGGVVAAGILLALLNGPVPRTPQTSQAIRLIPTEDLLADYDVLPIATGAHLMVNALNGPNDSTLLTVEHPLKERMNLATVLDFSVVKTPDVELNRVFLDTAEVK